MSRKVRDVYVEEVEFLRSCGASDLEILKSLNVTAATLARGLYRERAHTLAAPFSRIAQAARRARCQQCGGPRAADARARTKLCYRCVVPHLSDFQREAAVLRVAS